MWLVVQFESAAFGLGFRPQRDRGASPLGGCKPLPVAPITSTLDHETVAAPDESWKVTPHVLLRCTPRPQCSSIAIEQAVIL